MVLELLGTLVGLLYLWLEYRASIYLWAASIVKPKENTSCSSPTPHKI